MASPPFTRPNPSPGLSVGRVAGGGRLELQSQMLPPVILNGAAVVGFREPPRRLRLLNRSRRDHCPQSPVPGVQVSSRPVPISMLSFSVWRHLHDGVSGGNLIQIYPEIIRLGFGTKNALARIVRRRWPQNTVCMAQLEWDLTEGEAKGVVYAQASQRTIDKIKKHPRGGWDLSLEIEALVIGHDLEAHIENRRKHERDQYERLDRGLRKMASDLPLVLGMGGAGGR